MQVAELQIAVDGRARVELMSFYVDVLGFDASDSSTILVGFSRFVFGESDGESFYHFAFLLPGDRFDAALDWAYRHVNLLPDPESGSVIFDFDNWNAIACYFHDPAGNIVELIAHRGLAEASRRGPFDAREILEFSEVGIVCGNTRDLVESLERELGLALWDGTVDEPRRLAFVGERARTLILCPAGRGWLPTGRPAEIHPTRIVLSGVPIRDGHVVLQPHVILSDATP